MDRLSPLPFPGPSVLRQAAGMRQQLQTALQELTSGSHADATRVVGGDYSLLAATDHALARLSGFNAASEALSLTATAMQKALKVMHDAAQNLATTVLQASAGLNAGQLSTLARAGAQDFQTTVTMLNGQMAGQSLFGGVQAASLPLPDAATLLLAAETAVSGATTAEQLSDQLNSWLADPGGYASLYLGGDPRPPIAIAEGETAALPVTALDPSFRGTLSGLMKMALLDRGLFAGDHAMRASVGLSAAGDLVDSAGERLQIAAGIGMIEQQLSRAQARNSAEKSAHEISRNGILAADPYETAVRLKDLESRLDAFYTLTSRLSRLTLTDYLR